MVTRYAERDVSLKAEDKGDLCGSIEVTVERQSEGLRNGGSRIGHVIFKDIGCRVEEGN